MLQKTVRMNKTSRRRLIFSAFVLVLGVPAARSGQQLDGVWVGTEKLTLSSRTDCPKPNYQQSMSAKIIVAQGGSLLAVANGYTPGRYANLHWSGDTLVFEFPNRRKGELRLSADGKTLIEKGYVRRTTTIQGNAGVPTARVVHGAEAGHLKQEPQQFTGFTSCLDELTGTFHREK
jgi:hypothetical protein